MLQAFKLQASSSHLASCKRRTQLALAIRSNDQLAKEEEEVRVVNCDLPWLQGH
jgi:hypothetical protein